MEALGVKKTQSLIIYSQPGKLLGATRAYFILSAFGFKAKILDGGLKKYEDDGYPVEEGKNYEGERSSLGKHLSSPDPHLCQVCHIAGFSIGKMPDMELIDVRPANAFNGEATDNIGNFHYFDD